MGRTMLAANASDSSDADDQIVSLRKSAPNKRKNTRVTPQAAKKMKVSEIIDLTGEDSDEENVPEAVEAEAPFNPANNTKTFTCFPRLPTELRLKIFGYAADNDRAVIAQIKPPARHRHEYEYTLRRSGRGVPALLHVCREAREECIEDDILERIDIARARASNNFVTADYALQLMAAAKAGIANNRLGANKVVGGKEKDNCTHARWKLFTFHNSNVVTLCTETMRMYFCAQNDTFWGLNCASLDSFYVIRSFSGALKVPIAPYIRHFASNGAVNHVSDISMVRIYFPNIETITCLLDDHTSRWVSRKKGGNLVKHKYNYFKRTPEIDGQLSTTGFRPNDKAIVDAWIESIKRIKRTNYSIFLGASFLEAQKKDLELLRFRFEAQFAKNEIPSLWTKKKYRKGL